MLRWVLCRSIFKMVAASTQLKFSCCSKYHSSLWQPRISLLNADCKAAATVPQLKCGLCRNQYCSLGGAASHPTKSAQLHIIAQPLQCTSQITFAEVSRTPSLEKQQMWQPNVTKLDTLWTSALPWCRAPWILHTGIADDRPCWNLVPS